jgi:hypothetical protein
MLNTRLRRWMDMRRAKRPQSRARRITDRFLMVILTAYLLLLCVPQIVFAHSVSYRHFQIYSVVPLSPAIRTVLDRADQRLAGCEINEPHAVHRVYLCPSHAAFAFFAPGARMAFADNLPFVHNIFVNTADVASDTVTSGAAQYGRRTLSGVIAHECTHTLLADRFGQVAMLRQPSWKQEGYCDWVAGSTSFDPAAGARLLAQGRSDPSMSFFYYRACAAISILEGQRHWGVARIMGTPLSLDAVLGTRRMNPQRNPKDTP